MHAVELVRGRRHAVLHRRRGDPDRRYESLQDRGVHARRADGQLVDNDGIHRPRQQPHAQHGRSARSLRQDLRQAVDEAGPIPHRHGRWLFSL